MGVDYYIKAELERKLDRRMQFKFLSNMYFGNFENLTGWDNNKKYRVCLPENFDEATRFFKENYSEGYFNCKSLGVIGKDSGSSINFEAEQLHDYALCTMHLGRHNYSFDREELFERYDFRWHLEKLLEITNPYPIKRIWQENDFSGSKAVKHASDFVVEGEVMYSWSWHKDVVEERTPPYKGKIFEVLEIILANGLAYGAEFDDFHFELMTERPFPQEIVIKTKHGEFILVLERSWLMRIKPYYFLQDVSDVRPYAEILVALTRGLGLSSFRMYAGEKQPIALKRSCRV